MNFMKSINYLKTKFHKENSSHSIRTITSTEQADQSSNSGRASIAETLNLEQQQSQPDHQVCFLRESPFRVLRVAEKGNVREFNRICTKDPTALQIFDGRGRRAVHQASYKNHVGILEIIVKFNGDLNVLDNEGSTSLHVAVEAEATDAIDYLLSQGANGKIQNHKLQAPLHLACESNKILSLETLARHKKKLDVDQPGEHGRTPLHLACIYDNSKCVQLMLEELGASPRRTCSHSYLPIHEAARHASSTSLKILLQGGANNGCQLDEIMNFPDAEGNLLLHNAIHGGDANTVRLCVVSGAKISVPQHGLSTAVHLACSQGSLELVKLMFKLQPEGKEQCLNSCDLERMTPLHCAAMFDHKDLVKYLVSQGSSLDLLDKNRCTALHLAAARNAWQTVKEIIQIGGDIKQQDKYGRTFLHTFVKCNGDLNTILDEDMAMCLIPILEMKDKNGNTALHVAVKEGQIKSASKLLSMGASIIITNHDGENVFHIACRYGRYNVIKQLIKMDQFSAVINENNGNGLTPFHIAAGEGHYQVVQLLMKKGAFLHRDYDGRTPLHLAAENGHKNVMTLILDTHSHLINMVDKFGNTPLHSAARENQSKAVDLLLRLNCHLTYNFGGYSAIDLVLTNKFVEVAYTMVTHKSRADEVLGMTYGKHSCIMETLVGTMPGVAKAVLDRGIKPSTDKTDSLSFHVTYDFKWLTRVEGANGSGESSGGRKKLSLSPEQAYLPIMNQMVKHCRVNLLSHELSTKYLEMKWDVYGKYFQYSNLICYVIYLFLLTVAAVSDYNKDDEYFRRWQKFYLEPNNSSSSSSNQDNDNSVKETDNKTNMKWSHSNSSANLYYDAEMFYTYLRKTYGETAELYDNFNDVLYHFVTCLTIINLIVELVNIYRLGIKYFRGLDTWVWCIMTIFCFVTTGLHTLNSLSTSAMSTEILAYTYFNPCLAIATFLGWFYLLLVLQRFDAVGLYVSMFLEILKTLFRVLLIFSILIIAFAMAFDILLSNGSHIVFSNLPMSIMRTFSMMLGDLDFMNTFVYPNHCSQMEKMNQTHLLTYTVLNECKYQRRVPHPYATFPMVGLYMIFMPIVMINLLIGLAVGDIESVRKNAQLKRLTMQVQIHTNLEKLLPKCFLDKVDRTSVMEFPNQIKEKKFSFMEYFVTFFQHTAPRKEEKDDVCTESNDLMGAILDNSNILAQLTSEVDAVKNLIHLICHKMNVSGESTGDESTSVDEISPMLDIHRLLQRNATVREQRRPIYQRSESMESTTT